MSDKRAKNDKSEHGKKEQKKNPKKTFMLELHNGDKVSAKNTYMENTDLFKIDEINIDQINIFFRKEHE